jgi:hypothetical protein
MSFPAQKGAAATQLPPWQLPPAHGVLFAFAVHLPGLQRFLPFFFLHLPLSHCSHAPHACLHLPDLAQPSSG